MKIQWNKVTWYSKLAAVILSLGIFYLGYYLGQQVGSINSYPNITFARITHLSKHLLSKATQQTNTFADSAGVASAKLIGSWQSDSNPAQIVVYKADGIAEVYDNAKLSSSFPWIIEEFGAAITNPTNTKYIAPELTIKESGTADRYYKIKQLDASVLEIVYTYNNKLLIYKRVRQ